MLRAEEPVAGAGKSLLSRLRKPVEDEGDDEERGQDDPRGQHDQPEKFQHAHPFFSTDRSARSCESPRAAGLRQVNRSGPAPT